MEGSGEWLWTIGPREAQIQVHSRVETVRGILGQVTARFAQGTLWVSPDAWATRRLTIRGVGGSDAQCRLVVLDSRGRVTLQAERNDGLSYFEGMRLLRRFATGTPSRAGRKGSSQNVAQASESFDPERWRGDWDRRVRSARDLDDLFTWHGIDRTTGLDAAGPHRARRLVPGRLEELFLEAARGGLRLSVVVGLPGARLAVWKECRDIVLAAGVIVLADRDSHMMVRPAAMQRYWVVRHQCALGASLFLEAHDGEGDCLVRLGSEACPRIGDSRSWKRLLEAVHSTAPLDSIAT